ncbi:MAG: trypsin-like peptidase domain-containing protein [Pseudomonadota bacterium]
MPLNNIKVYFLHHFILALLFFSPAVFSQSTPITLSLPDLYEKLRTSVVVIDINKSNQIAKVDESGEPQIQNVNTAGEGSGILISDLHILTAAHVVHGVDKLEVTFYDGTKIAAKVISSDVRADLSLVQLNSKHPTYKPAQLGDSDKIRIGEAIFVIGAPYNVSYTLTRGIISGRHSVGSESDFYKSEFFQTDAALNPGNSGGPLFNMQGQVIGIASFIKSKSGGNEGLGFAVTINSAKKIMLDKPPFYSGIDSFVVTGLLVKALNIGQASAILVKKVAQGSSADITGLKGGSLNMTYQDEELVIGGDIILSINDIHTDSKANLQKIENLLTKLGNKGSYKLIILREGKHKTLFWKGLHK